MRFEDASWKQIQTENVVKNGKNHYFPQLYTIFQVILEILLDLKLKHVK
jgi:hypothetical protein